MATRSKEARVCQAVNSKVTPIEVVVLLGLSLGVPALILLAFYYRIFE